MAERETTDRSSRADRVPPCLAADLRPAWIAVVLRMQTMKMLQSIEGNEWLGLRRRLAVVAGIHLARGLRRAGGMPVDEAALARVEVGFQVYLGEGQDPFGAVRDVAPGTATPVTVYVENGGDFRVPRAAVRAVHDGKVILDPDALDPGMRQAIAHAHDREEPDL
jgi:hypothetical protein